MVRRLLVLIPVLGAAALAPTAAIASPTASATHARQAAPLAHTSKAGKKEAVFTGFYNGKTVHYYNFGPTKVKPGSKLSPIWVFTNGASRQGNILGSVPSQKSYTPLWRVSTVTWKSGATRRVLKSASDINKAAAAGELTVTKSKTVLNCPVLGFGQQRNPGVSGGHTIDFYNLGAVKVAPGNTLNPLYTVTNGATGQKDVFEGIAPGQTAYPPLWSIVKVTWKSGSTPRLLTSKAAIKKAAAAGQLKLQKTPLVLNCPIV